MVGSSGTPNESLKDAFAADGFSRRLAAAGANALLGLCFDGGILVAILLSKVIYQLVEAFRWDVALLTLIGLLWASANAESLHALPDFIKGLFVPDPSMPRPDFSQPRLFAAPSPTACASRTLESYFPLHLVCCLFPVGRRLSSNRHRNSSVGNSRAGRVQKRAGLFECGERLAGLRADPNFAAFEHFFFPDRHGLFDFFNGEAASRECRVAVRR